MGSRDSYRVADKHPVEVAGGQMYGPGEEIKGLDECHPHNKGLIERGQIVKQESAKRRQQQSAVPAEAEATTSENEPGDAGEEEK